MGQLSTPAFYGARVVKALTMNSMIFVFQISIQTAEASNQDVARGNKFRYLSIYRVLYHILDHLCLCSLSMSSRFALYNCNHARALGLFTGMGRNRFSSVQNWYRELLEGFPSKSSVAPSNSLIRLFFSESINNKACTMTGQFCDSYEQVNKSPWIFPSLCSESMHSLFY